MAKENTREQRIKYAFGAHPSVKELHVTSDDQMFIQPTDAVNHAKSLEDDSVEVAKRIDYVENKITPVAPNQLDLEREALAIRHEELFGKKPAPNAGIEKLKEKIKVEEERLAKVAEEEAKAEGDKVNSDEEE